jgi:hypothetical protein
LARRLHATAPESTTSTAAVVCMHRTLEELAGARRLSCRAYIRAVMWMNVRERGVYWLAASAEYVAR